MPKLLTTPFATSGLKNDVPTTTGTSPNSATYNSGFPDITMKSFANGGLAPSGKDFNGIFYDITDNIVYQTQGGRYKFDGTYATSIGGYPLGAILLLNDGVTDVVSTVANNLTDPNVSMTGWVYKSQTLVTNDYTTLAALSAKDGVIAFVKASGISGEFVYKSASTATPNGGTIIASNQGGNWVRIYSDIVRAEWFGVVGDGQIITGSCTQGSNTVTLNQTITLDLSKQKSVVVTNGITSFTATVQAISGTTLTLNTSATFTATTNSVYIGTDNKDSITKFLQFYQWSYYGGGRGLLPMGIILTSGNIKTSQGKFHLEGQGEHLTELIYIGMDDGKDFIYSEGNPGGYYAITNLTIDTATVKTSGWLFHVFKQAQVTLTGFKLGDQYRFRNAKNGMYLENIDQFRVDHYSINVKSTGVALAGDSETSGAYDCWFTHGKIAGHDYAGILIGGGMDNVYFDQSMITDNNNNLIIDNSLYQKPNGYIEIGSQCPLEWAWGNGAIINDTLAQPAKTHITIRGHVNWSRQSGINVGALPNSTLTVFSSAISDNSGDGLVIHDTTAKIGISEATQFCRNGGYGITANSYYKLNLNLQNFNSNVLAAFNSNIDASFTVNGFNNTSYADVNAAGTTQSDAAPISNDFVFIHGKTSTLGVRLPSNRVGGTITIVNSESNTLRLYPHSGAQIGSGATNNFIDLQVGKTYTLHCVSNTVWWVSSIV